MRIDVDWTALDAATVGARDGVRRGDLTALSARVAGLHDDVAAAAAAGSLPHLDAARDENVTRWLETGSSWGHGRGKVTRLLVIGEPAAVGAVAVLAGPSAPGVSLVAGLDPEAIGAALLLPGKARLIVLDGPTWVRELAHTLAPRCSAVTVFRGDGLSGPGLTLPGCESWDVRGAADPRFGVVGAAAMALLGFSGRSAAGLQDALTGGRERNMVRAMLQNPAYRLAASLSVLEQRRGRQGVHLLLDTGGLLPWAAWASGAWAAIASKRVADASGATRLRGGVVTHGLFADEAAIQRLAEGPASALVVTVEVGRAAVDSELLPGANLAQQGQQLVNQQVAWLGRRHQPAVRLRLPELNAAGLAELSVLWLQAALVSTALDEGDPLRMDGADQWRGWLESPPLHAQPGWPTSAQAR
jgi:hypothetical protein